MIVPLLSSRALGNPPNPIAALTPVAWYRYGVGITGVSAVSAWADQSGNGNNLVQASSGNQPLLQSDNSILFDGVDDNLSVTFTLNQPLTYYVLGKQLTSVSTGRIIGGPVGACVIVMGASSPFIMLNAGSPAATNGNWAINTYGVLANVMNGASSSLQVNNTAAVTGNPGAGNPGGITIGAASNGLFPANIQVKEVIAFSSAHSAAQQSTVITYLATVGGLNI